MACNFDKKNLRHTERNQSNTKKLWTHFNLYRLYKAYTHRHTHTRIAACRHKSLEWTQTLNLCDTNNIFAHLRIQLLRHYGDDKVWIIKEQQRQRRQLEINDQKITEMLTCKWIAKDVRFYWKYSCYSYIC